MTARSKKITDSARGENCTMRLLGICNFNPETVVFAHVGRRRGTGIKCGDNFGVYACSACHDIIDKRTSTRYPGINGEILRALEETQEKLIEKGLLVTG
ncbi:MAG: nuclease domain-containing protein [Shewanella sp.]